MTAPLDDIKESFIQELSFIGKIIINLILDALIVVVMMVILKFLNLFSSVIGAGDEETVQLILRFSHSLYLVIYIILAGISIYGVIRDAKINKRPKT